MSFVFANIAGGRLDVLFKSFCYRISRYCFLLNWRLVMMFILICYLLELVIGLGISLYLRAVYYPFFEIDLVIKSWLLVNVYKAPFYLILSFFGILIMHGEKRRLYLIGIYLAIAFLTYMIVVGTIFHLRLFNFKQLWVPTYGEFERQLLIAFLISTIAFLLKWKSVAKFP